MTNTDSSDITYTFHFRGKTYNIQKKVSPKDMREHPILAGKLQLALDEFFFTENWWYNSCQYGDYDERNEASKASVKATEKLVKAYDTLERHKNIK